MSFLLAVWFKLLRPKTDEPKVHYGYWKPGAGGPSRKVERLNRSFPHAHRGFNILYTVNGNFCPIGLAKASKRAAIPIIYNANGLYYRAWFGDGWEAQNERLKQIYALADYVFYQSKFSRMCAGKFLGSEPSPSEILYNAVDVKSFVPQTSRPFNSRKPVFLTTGFFTRRDHLEPAVQAVAQIVRGGLDARLLIAGKFHSDHLLTDLTSLILKLKMKDRVSVLPPYSLASAPSIYQQADIFLHMRYNDNCPSVVLEAMACGLPVVCASTGGTCELVGSGEGGVMVPSIMDWDQLYSLKPDDVVCGIEKVVSEYEAFAQRARHRVEQNFAIDEWYKRHDTIFRTVLGAFGTAKSPGA